MEQSLVQQVGRGEWLDLTAKGELIDEAAMRSWGDDRTCRATVIRDILRGKLAADPDPHGLRLRGARITGRLDLENLSTGVNFRLSDCLLEEGIFVRDSRMTTVVLNGCQIEHPAEPPLDTARLTCSLFSLAGQRSLAAQVAVQPSWSAPTSAANSPARGRSCATTPAPPCSPTNCKSARTWTSPAGSAPPATGRLARLT